MAFDHRKQHTATSGVATHSAPVPGKQTLTDGLVQRQAQATPAVAHGGGEPTAATAPAPAPGGPRPTLQMLFGVQRAAAEPGQVHAAAARGTATTATQLPHFDQIQRSFGRHDVSGIQAHVGPEATASARDMGAAAYATGHHVVLGDKADLHTAAHEAAHVVQQRGGVQLAGGVGQSGDAYERHADAVADLVVQGKSSEDLLDTMAGNRTGGHDSSVQRVELVQRKDYAGTTVGVEQELTGHKLVLPDPNDRGVIGYVSKGGARLVEFTSDMGGDGVYTIELRTTPCEKDNDQAVQDRKNATAEMLRAIEEAGQNRDAVPAGVRGEFKISILRKNHKIELSPYGTGFSNQASIGIQTDQLMTAGAGDKDSALLMKYARWFSPALASELPPEGLGDPARAKRVYAMVGSTISFLADIVRSGGPEGLVDGRIQVNIYDPKIKNRWGALPRTPPWEWLDVLPSADGTKVREALRTRFQADPYDKAAFTHISTKQDLAGHPVPASTIKGQHSSVFEFREVPAEMQRYLHGGSEVAEETPAARPAMPANLLAALRGGVNARRPRVPSDSDG